MLRFDDKIVLITGAANGLGREYALSFAERGALVIVNDLGGESNGEGRSMQPADLVVQEIIKKGGKAVANYDSVEDGQKIIDFIIEKFGKIDVIVHNAGIIRDKSFNKMSYIDWDLVYRVHLKSVFLITKAAWPHLVKQKFGRIITISSSSGIYGNFGQANYSAAKSAIIGLSKSLSVEGRKSNITFNTVAPIAGSRITRTVMDDDSADALKAKYVSPLILFLSHHDTKETGGLFECGAGWVGKLRWERTRGANLRAKFQQITPEIIKEKWEEIVDFSESTHPANISEANSGYFKALEEIQQSADADEGNISGSSCVHSYEEKDIILYALGVGVKMDELDNLKFLYENHSSFCTLPTFAVVVPFPLINKVIASFKINGQSIDPTQMLHGEQFIEVTRPFKSRDTLTSVVKAIDVMDKGKAVALVINIEIFSSTKELVALNQMVVFLKNIGGFQGNRNSSILVPTLPVPNRISDVCVEEKTFKDQGALYRLSGDFNPLHIDPSFSSMAGFPVPILHGLCIYGIAARQVIKTFCNNDVKLFKSVKARFSSPVIPGETIVTEMWREKSRIHFQSKIKESNKLCLTGGYLDYSTDFSSKL